MKKNYLKTKVVIFGGSGFLGSHIADQLTDKNYKVFIFDKLRSKYLRDNQKMIIGDITNFKDVRKAIRKMDFVLHFAAVSDIDQANKNPMKTIKYNILGTSNILEAIRKNKKVKKMIYASSIYARSKDGGFYSTSKRSTESIIENYYDNFKINFQNPIEFTKDSNIETITTRLNKLLENMIVKNPDQWIWSHNRWK